jgi:TonB family protein
MRGFLDCVKPMPSLMRLGNYGAVLLAATLIFAPLQSGAQDSTPDGARKVLTRTPADYPAVAKSMNIHGTVKLEVQVAPNGTVKNMSVRGGHPMLVQSALNAVGHWHFEPAAHETKEVVELKFGSE